MPANKNDLVPSPYIVTVELHSVEDKVNGSFEKWYQDALHDMLADAAGYKPTNYSIGDRPATSEDTEQQSYTASYRLDRFEIFHQRLPETLPANPTPWVASKLQDGKALVVRGLQLLLPIPIASVRVPRN